MALKSMSIAALQNLRGQVDAGFPAGSECRTRPTLLDARHLGDAHSASWKSPRVD
jgi:hypothetical protein